MNTGEVTREEMWAKQNLSLTDVDYSIWEGHKYSLRQLSRVNRSCTFVVDVCKCSYTFASSNFADLLGYDSRKIATIERQGDYLESRIHPADLSEMQRLQVDLGKFIYSRPAGERNDYCNIFSFRVRNARQQYVRVTSRHQVLEQSPGGKAWLILGNMDIAPGQKQTDGVECTVLNLKNGELFSAGSLTAPRVLLSPRETEILRLIQKGFLSKEIADRLGISIHTVNIHRQNLLHKLGVQNAIEAINKASASGLLR